MDDERPAARPAAPLGGRLAVLWERYVFRRGPDAEELWDSLFRRRSTRLLYITGRGFDLRMRMTLDSFVSNLRLGGAQIENAQLLLVGFPYELAPELVELTESNAAAARDIFDLVGKTTDVEFGRSAAGEDDLSATNALRIATEGILERIPGCTDVVLDVSSLPRILALALTTSLLQALVPERSQSGSLGANGVNFQVIVAEDSSLDAHIHGVDPSNDLVLIPGFSSAFRAESMRDWPLAWFPILGEHRESQLEKVMAEIPGEAEIYPVLPHPSADARRADRLLVEYRAPLFDVKKTPISNILLVDEKNPFEAYRRLLHAMQRYRESMRILGGCRLVVTPLSSKLVTIGAGLACFEMRPANGEMDYGVAIPYATPTRYEAEGGRLRTSEPEIACLLLTGEAYSG